MPIIEVLETSSGERRYRVFQNNAKVTYYESQLQALAVKEMNGINSRSKRFMRS